MDDMNAFERQLSTEVAGLMGPVRPVHDAAVFTAITTATQSPMWRFQSMFDATKYVVAGVIVALFGGFLLAGVLTQSSDESEPAIGASASVSAEAGLVDESATPGVSFPSDGMVVVELLAGVAFEAEQVRPGLLRVLSDGAGHELSEARSIALGPQEAIWATEKNQGGPQGRWLYRVGQTGSIPGLPFRGKIDAVSSDGTLWFGSGDGLHTYDGTSWSRIGDGLYAGVTAAPDGSVWALHDWRVVSIKDGAATTSPRADGLEGVIVDWTEEPTGGVLITSGGEAWIWGSGWDERAGTDDPALRVSGGLLHFDGEQWRSFKPLGNGKQFTVHSLVAGSDGTAWALVDIGAPYHHGAAPGDRRLIAHYDGKRWSKTSGAKALQATQQGSGPVFLKELVGIDENGHPILRYEGLAQRTGDHARRSGWLTFDGTAWSRLSGVARTPLFTTPRGDVWERSPNGRVFVITAEAEAATE